MDDSPHVLKWSGATTREVVEIPFCLDGLYGSDADLVGIEEDMRIAELLTDFYIALSQPVVTHACATEGLLPDGYEEITQ